MSDKLTEEVRETMKSSFDAYNKGDIDTCVFFYDERAKLMPPGFVPAIGREEIAKGLNHSRSVNGVLLLDHEPLEVEILGDDVAFAHLNTQPRDGDGNSKGNTQSLTIWMKKDGKWKIYREMFNSRP
ncbi:hypothetical protein CAPTEDRAFT_218400 [Capitella teleta]|uniref:DUF4440 domain-containing protein n=1 Tax=Capitella teleta TaxID=283909 RepID=R7TDM0_CAPTE|nr:hypothetical protein CAPTEDRAFT_218400 [Capitella teleta]|eukprot:ELT91818.1 hypothetical protein CAPTEDRAFT_218400 [Capitella teleta]